MGVIKMKRVFGFMHKGYSYGTDVLYVYCDRCGSFNIKTYIGLRKWVFILVFISLMGLFMVTAEPNSGWTVIFLGCLLLLIFFSNRIWGDKDYRCRKCGNRHIVINHPKDYASVIWKYNTLKYPADMDMIDVPDERTQKRYQGYWDDDYR